MIHQLTLANGLKVIVDERAHMESASAGLWMPVGGRYETEQEQGLSHFVEHMVFKGTAQRSCQKIKEDIEGLGGDLNAFTCKEFTCYYAKVLGGDFAQAIDVLADIVFNPTLSPQDMEQEKGVIIEEIRMYQDSPAQLVHDYLDEIIWPNQPMGWSLTGEEEQILSYSEEHLRQYHKGHYRPEKAVLAVSGAVSAKQVFAFAQTRLEQYEPGSNQVFKKAHQLKEFSLKCVPKETEQVHLAMGFPSFERNSNHRAGTGLLSIIMGANMSSRLFHQLREEEGLVYDIRSSNERYQDCGVFEISAGIDSDKLLPALHKIQDVLKNVCDQLISDEELIRAKRYYEGSIRLSMEKNSERMYWWGEEALCTNLQKSYQDLIQEANQLTASDILTLSQTIFKASPGIALIAPRKTIKQLEPFRWSL